LCITVIDRDVGDKVTHMITCVLYTICVNQIIHREEVRLIYVYESTQIKNHPVKLNLVGKTVI
jgi:hypothetical protein